MRCVQKKREPPTRKCPAEKDVIMTPKFSHHVITLLSSARFECAFSERLCSYNSLCYSNPFCHSYRSFAQAAGASSFCPPVILSISFCSDYCSFFPILLHQSRNRLHHCIFRFSRIRNPGGLVTSHYQVGNSLLTGKLTNR